MPHIDDSYNHYFGDMGGGMGRRRHTRKIYAVLLICGYKAQKKEI